MDRWETQLLQNGDEIPQSAQRIDGHLTTHLTEAVVREMYNCSKLLQSLKLKIYMGYDERYVDVDGLIEEEEVRVVYIRQPPYNMPPGEFEFFRHLQMNHSPDIGSRSGSRWLSSANMSTRRQLVEEELESLRMNTLRDDGANVDGFYYSFLVMVHDLNLGIFSEDLKTVAAYTLGYTGSCCERRAHRSGKKY